MHHISFGNVLKEARLAKGMDLATVSRELRIRQDIIVAIESSDFARMPSRGYTRNMIIAYARLVGLNAHDVSRMYLDQEYAYQVEQAHRSVGTAVRMHDVEGDRASSRSRSHSNREEPQEVYDGSTNFLGRRLYSQDPDIPRPVSSGPSNPTRGMSHAGGTAHRARRSAMPEGKYTNLYQAPRNMPDPNRRRNAIIAIALAVVIIVALIVGFALSHQSAPQANIPVTGATATAPENTSSEDAQTQDQQKTETTEEPPTEFTLEYSVSDGSSTYIEVIVDGKTKEANDVDGPASETYTSSDSIKFVCSETKGVTLKIDGEEVKLKADSSGIVSKTYKFSDILDAWYDDHPDVERPSSSKSATKSSSSSSSSSSDSSDSSSSSSSSSNE